MVKQNPATDPVSAAMSAIESALNLTDDDETVLAEDNAAPPQLVPAKPTAATPANDDRENVGAILQAMNARPASRTPFIIALVASLLWAAICALYGYVS